MASNQLENGEELVKGDYHEEINCCDIVSPFI